MQILNDTLDNLKGDVISGDVVFKLYDTYGFPADLTADVAREKDVSIDQDGFDQCMQQQRERAQKSSQFGTDYNDQLSSNSESEFTGYEESQGNTTIVELFKGAEPTKLLNNGDEGIVILGSTPFYAESGGQIGDTGILKLASGEFEVSDTIKLGEAIAHRGVARTAIAVGDSVNAEIDVARREAIKLNHSATHLMHAALRHVLGEHVTQKGSLVDAQRLRFDFSHYEGVSSEQLLTIERLVNQEIRENRELVTQLMDLDEAKSSGAMALFGEKYDEKVRVVSMGSFSVELCGGTHIKQTGDIGLFKIVAESGIASGVRRIEAITGNTAILWVQQQSNDFEQLAGLLKTDQQSVGDKVVQLQEQNKALEKQLDQAKKKLASQAGSDLLASSTDINGVKVLCAKLQDVDAKDLRVMMDDLKNQLGSGILILGLPQEKKVNLIAGVTKDLVGKVKAGELVNFVAQQVGGKGGGRPDMAQAGGTNPEHLDAALASVTAWLEERL